MTSSSDETSPAEPRPWPKGDGEEITYLLAAMRLAAGSDPVPGRVDADARAVFDLRLPGSITATPVDVVAAAGVRSGAEPQLHRFTTDELTVDVEMSISDGRLEVAGQVSPAPEPDAWVEVRTPHISKVRVPSPDGHFAATGLPPGWVSVVYHRPEQAPVATRWLRVRA
ncbi:hypothetical protein [Acrocarpospora catenulata]|uniref:hypothetical protein n=1 Tax=Acrocarpospora catenulata TaxID=2836182 RepID=UPI002023B14F|nr:hypothetical protein [Acrocarpospora catenulata]